MSFKVTPRVQNNSCLEYLLFIVCIILFFSVAAPAAYDSLLPQSGEIAEYFSNNECK